MFDWADIQGMTANVISEYASGELLTVGTAQVACTEGTMRAAMAGEQWGRDNQRTMPVCVAAADLPTLPAVRSTVTYRSTTYRILDIAENKPAGIVTLYLGDA